MSEQEAVQLLLSLGYTISKETQYYTALPNPYVQPICCPHCGLLGGHRGLMCPRLMPNGTGEPQP